MLMLSVAIVGKRLDRDAATGIKQPNDLQILGIHQPHQVLHDDVDAVLVEVTVIAEAEEIEFQTLALHHQRAGDVINNKVSEIWLAGLGAQRGKLRTIQSYKIFILRMFVLKHLQHFWCIVVTIVSVLVAQQCDTLQFLFVS